MCLCSSPMASSCRVLVGYFLAAGLILSGPGFSTALRLNEAGKSSFTPQQSSQFWVSNEGNYTFGFKDAVGHAGEEYLLSVWHSADPNKTALWWPKSVNDGDPIVRDGATFNYTSTGSLELYNASAMLVWSSNTSSSYGELQDTGNLVLLLKEKAVWQSIEDPRDSLMLVGLNDQNVVANKPNLLKSRGNQSSYVAGRFHLATGGEERAYLYALDPLSNTDYVYSYAHARVNGSGFQIWRSSGKTFTSRNTTTQRLTLDYDGNLRVYSWDSHVSSWQWEWQILDDKCMLGSPCGPFGLCKVDAGARDGVRLDCTCPPGYHARVAGDNSQGCASYISFNASCGSGSGSGNYDTTIVELPNSDYDFNDMRHESQVSLDYCKALCLKDCACMAASYRIYDSTCFVKGNSTAGYLLNGYSPDTNTLLIKVVTTVSRKASGGVKGVSRFIIGVGVAAVVLVAAGTVGCAWLLWRRRRSGGRAWWTWTLIGQNKERDPVSADAGPVRFKYQELVAATNNFSETLGEGGFGKVYKGWVRGRNRGFVTNTGDEQQQVAVAVKVLKGATRDEEGGQRHLRGGLDQQGEKQFRAEMSTLGKIHHVNLVSLLGYCTGGQAGEKRLLVYEYMEKGSLDRYLSTSVAAAAHNMLLQPLAWAIRYSIALGTARGIAYLHHECSPRILHCDIKPQNVLLDEHFSAKVADFGLAKRFHHHSSHLTMSAVRGTRGYMAPEWLKSDEVTSKVDVYSFGMLLLELVRGLNSMSDISMSLIDWAFQCISTDVLISQLAAHSDNHIINVEKTSTITTDMPYPPQQRQEEDAIEQIHALKVGLWCVQPMPSMRPSMSHVVELMEGTIPMEDPPNPAPNIATKNLPYFLSDNNPSSSSSQHINSYSIVSPR